MNKGGVLKGRRAISTTSTPSLSSNSSNSSSSSPNSSKSSSNGNSNSDNGSPKSKASNTDDIFDNLLNLEEHVFQDAVMAGERDTMSEKRSDEALCTGFARGFSIGLEVAFYEEALNQVITSDDQASSAGKVDPPPSPHHVNSAASARYKSSMQKIIASIKPENDLSKDISSDLATLRSLYKLLNEPAGRFFFTSEIKGSASNEW